MKYDFLFVYEVKNRELENIILLKYELERRGYTVMLLETWKLIHHPKLFKIDASVVVSFAFYSDGQAEMCCYYAKNVHKMLNMQWEQLYSVGDEEDYASIYHIKGLALNAAHISWGKFNSEKLIYKFGLPEKNVWLTGQLAFDFFKPRLNGYYLTREDLCKKYNLDKTKKLCLFISSFSMVDMPASSLNDEIYQNLANSVAEQLRVAIQSQQALFSWCKNILPKHSEITFIYRPHPAEVGNTDLFELEKLIPNFVIIRDESVKQWIITCDKIYTWYSTSIAEAYAAHKEISVIRPVKIPEKMDIRIYSGCQSIGDENSFEDSFINSSNTVLNDEIMNYYYTFLPDNEYTYEKICNKLEEMLKTDDYSFDFSNSVSDINFLLRFRSCCSRIIFNPLAHLAKKSKKLYECLIKNKRFGRYFEEYDFVERMSNNNYSNKKEIHKIQNHIKNVIEKNLVQTK